MLITYPVVHCIQNKVELFRCVFALTCLSADIKHFCKASNRLLDTNIDSYCYADFFLRIIFFDYHRTIIICINIIKSFTMYNSLNYS